MEAFLEIETFLSLIPRNAKFIFYASNLMQAIFYILAVVSLKSCAVTAKIISNSYEPKNVVSEQLM